METNKRYTIMVFSKKIDFLIPVINKIVNLETPFFQHFTVENTTFVSFYSKKQLKEIKTVIKKLLPELHYLIFDISNRGENFDLEYEGLEEFLLMTNVSQEVPEEPKKKVSTPEPDLSLDDLLELVHKNGFKTLTKKERKKLEDYSKD